jgi:hypothetical protein
VRQRRPPAAGPAPAVRLLSPVDRPRLVLSGSGGRLRGELLVANDGPGPVDLEVTAVEADVPAARAPAGRQAALEPTRMTLAPGTTTRARLTGSLDPFTPPGRYAAKVTVNGVPEDAVLEVSEHVDLSLSESELVVFADGGPQHRHVVARNRGNVPLRISRLGPIVLAYDAPRRSLLSRMGVAPEERRVTRLPARDPDEPQPTVEARLDEPVEVAPGEAVALDWTVEVKGSVPPGIRHRATAALYTSDITFVVTPPQDGRELAAAEAPPALEAPLAPEEKPATRGRASAPASRQKRRQT